MAPEQARGKTVDRRADVWSFGVVCSKCSPAKSPSMATPFRTLSRPSFVANPIGRCSLQRAQPTFSQLMRRCLDKEARQRLQSIGEARIAIESAMGRPQLFHQQRDIPAHRTPLPTGSALENLVSRLLPAAALALLLLAAGSYSRIFSSRRKARIARNPFHVAPPPGTSLDPNPRSVAISRDGTRIVLSASTSDGSRLYLRDLTGRARRHRRVRGRLNPVFSPDSKWLAFLAGGQLKKISIDGGTVVSLADGITSLRGISWGAGSQYLLLAFCSSGILRVSDGGGTAQPVTKLQIQYRRTRAYLPGNSAGRKNPAVHAYAGGNVDEGALVAQKIGSQDKKNQSSPRVRRSFFASEPTVFMRYGNLISSDFDPDQLEVCRFPREVHAGCARCVLYGTALVRRFSRTGTLIYANGGKQAVENHLVLAEHDAKAQPSPVKSESLRISAVFSRRKTPGA